MVAFNEVRCDLTAVTGRVKLCYPFLGETPSICLPAIGIKGGFYESLYTGTSLGEKERREYPE